RVGEPPGNVGRPPPGKVMPPPGSEGTPPPIGRLTGPEKVARAVVPPCTGTAAPPAPPVPGVATAPALRATGAAAPASAPPAGAAPAGPTPPAGPATTPPVVRPCRSLSKKVEMLSCEATAVSAFAMVASVGDTASRVASV